MGISDEVIGRDVCIAIIHKKSSLDPSELKRQAAFIVICLDWSISQSMVSASTSIFKEC